DVVVIDRRRHGHHEEGDPLEVGQIAGDLQRRALELGLGDLLVAIEPPAELVDLLLVDVEPDRPRELAREGKRHGEPDVSQTDDGDLLWHALVAPRAQVTVVRAPRRPLPAPPDQARVGPGSKAGMPPDGRPSLTGGGPPPGGRFRQRFSRLWASTSSGG